MTQSQYRWLDKFPEQGDKPIPVTPYLDEDYYNKEIEKVFKRKWLKVARIEELPKPGDYKVKKIHFADTSVIIIHGKDGQVRAFHNTCSHRGNKVVVEEGNETFGSSKAAVVTCRFHGWVYNASGELVSVPEEERFYPCFTREKNGLEPVHCDTWNGFIFINLSSQPDQTLHEFLGGYGNHFDGYPFDKMKDCYGYDTELNCNWKVAHDAFAEAYHVATIHAGSFPNVFSSGLQAVKLWDEHRTCAVHLQQPKPTETAKYQIARAGASLVDSKSSSMLPPDINPEKKNDFSFELSVCFPNLLIHVAEGIWFTHQFWPLSQDRCIWEGRYYVKEPQTNSQRWAIEFAQVLQRNAWLEDTATMEATQEALKSGAKQELHLQDEEILIRHGFNVIERYVNT